MRVVIFCDMEGVCGIQAWEQVDGRHPAYSDGRRLYTNEINAAVRGAKAAGATDIIVVDCHGAGGGFKFKSFIPDQLEAGAQYVLGHPWARYTEAFEQGCDAILFVGAHAMAGVPDGVLCHTVSSEEWHHAWINDTLVGESGILAAVAGCWNVPVIFAAGDEATCREVTELLGEDVVTAAVKKGLGRFSARNMAPSDACALIEKKIAEAILRKKWPQPYKPQGPVTFRVEVATPDAVNDFVGRAGVVAEGPRLISCTAEDFWQAWDKMWYRH